MKKISNKQRGLAAIALAGIVATGGSSFALWSDSAQVGGGTIMSGNLDVEASTGSWTDVSADRTDSPHAIDLATYRIVPGDTIEGKYGVKAALEGDNLVAKLGLKNATTGAPVATGDLAKNLTMTYSLVDADGNKVASATNVPVGTDADVTFASEDNTNKGNLPTLPKTLGDTDNYSVVVDVTFDEATPNQELVKTQAALENMTVTLDQVRSGADGYKG